MVCSTVYIIDASNGIINVYSMEGKYVISLDNMVPKQVVLEAHIMSAWIMMNVCHRQQFSDSDTSYLCRQSEL